MLLEEGDLNLNREVDRSCVVVASKFLFNLRPPLDTAVSGLPIVSLAVDPYIVPWFLVRDLDPA